jgi:zinc transport system ATP-binding protein
MANKVIEIRNLTYRYGSRVALADVNLAIYEQEFIGLLGPNGSGKTTLLKVILGLLPVKDGEVLLFGTPLNRFNEWQRIGYVSQKANSFNSSFPVSVFEVVSMGLFGRKGLFARLNEQDERAVLAALKLVGLEGYEKRTIGMLSGGEQQRVFIARALVNNPDLLILDEPTVGIDIEATNLFYQLLDRLNREHGLTIILVSHDVGVVSNKVTNILCLNKQLLYCGQPEFFNEKSMEMLQKVYGDNMELVNHDHHGHDHYFHPHQRTAPEQTSAEQSSAREEE